MTDSLAFQSIILEAHSAFEVGRGLLPGWTDRLLLRRWRIDSNRIPVKSRDVVLTDARRPQVLLLPRSSLERRGWSPQGDWWVLDEECLTLSGQDVVCEMGRLRSGDHSPCRSGIADKWMSANQTKCRPSSAVRFVWKRTGSTRSRGPQRCRRWAHEVRRQESLRARGSNPEGKAAARSAWTLAVRPHVRSKREARDTP